MQQGQDACPSRKFCDFVAGDKHFKGKHGTLAHCCDICNVHLLIAVLWRISVITIWWQACDVDRDVHGRCGNTPYTNRCTDKPMVPHSSQGCYGGLHGQYFLSWVPTFNRAQLLIMINSSVWEISV